MLVSLRLGNDSREDGREGNVRVSGEMQCTINIHELGGDALELKKNYFRLSQVYLEQDFIGKGAYPPSLG